VSLGEAYAVVALEAFAEELGEGGEVRSAEIRKTREARRLLRNFYGGSPSDEEYDAVAREARNSSA
jgi:hypothetical protein